MSGDKYIISDQHAPYFLTMTVVEWIDIFTRMEIKEIVVDSLKYCIEQKGLELYAWVLMPNHLHLVARVKEPATMSGFLRDFKKYTSKRFIDFIQEGPESRAEWLLDKFGFAAKRTGRAENFKVWRDDNHAIYLDSSIDALEKVDYVHENPVQAGWVDNPEDYVFSSARDYARKKGLLNIVLI